MRRPRRAAGAGAAGGQREMREPQRGEGEHQRVEPDRDDSDQQAQRSVPRRPSPTASTARRRGSHRPCPWPAARQRCARRTQCAARPALACAASTSKASTRHVEPAPDQRRQHQHQRRHEPQRHADAPGPAARPACSPATTARPATRRAPPRSFQAGEAPLDDQVHERRRHQQATSSSDTTTITGTASATTISGAISAAQRAAADRLQPLQQRVDQRPFLERARAPGHRRLPVEPAQHERQRRRPASSGSSDHRITRGCRQ